MFVDIGSILHVFVKYTLVKTFDGCFTTHNNDGNVTWVIHVVKKF